MKRVEYLKLPNGREPFREWFHSLEICTRSKIRAYIDRIAVGGGRKSIKSLGNGIFEIKMKFDGGIRVYFAEDGQTLLILLVGGTKDSQGHDIEKAKKNGSDHVSK